MAGVTVEPDILSLKSQFLMASEVFEAIRSYEENHYVKLYRRTGFGLGLGLACAEMLP